MSVRSRQSTAAATPGPSRARSSTAAPSGSQATFPLPEYQPPSHPLTNEARDHLVALGREFPAQNLTKQYQDVLKLVSAQAGLVGEEIWAINQEKVARRRRAEKQGEELDEDVENRAEEEISQVERMITRMEGVTRKGIDGEHNINVIGKALQEIHTNAGTAPPRSSQRATQRSQLQTQTQNSRVTMDGESQPDPSAQDTAMPDAPPAPALVTMFEQSLETQTDRYDAQTMAARYAQHPIYTSFKRGTHEGRHGNEGPPLEHHSRWFETSKHAQPGVTGTGDDDDDDDIAVARVTVSTKCPLTLREFQAPLTSKLCPHSFEKSAILELIRASTQPPAPGRRGAATPAPGWVHNVECPVPGCSKRLTEADLWENTAHIESIERAKRLEMLRREMQAEDEGGGGDGGARDGELIESDVGSQDGVEDIEPDAAAAAPAVRVKKERLRRSQMEEIQDAGDGFEED